MIQRRKAEPGSHSDLLPNLIGFGGVQPGLQVLEEQATERFLLRSGS